MNLNLFRCAAIVVALLTLLLSDGKAALVLLNGSLTGSTGAATAAPDWQIANATPDLVGASGPFNNTGVPWAVSPDGGTFARAVGTGDSATQEAFEQTVSGFQIGELYTVSFHQTNLSFRVTATNEWRNHSGYWALFADDVLVGQSAAISGPAVSTAPIVWTADEIQFVAADTTLTLRFEAFTTADPTPSAAQFAFMGIDGIDIPEPASGALPMGFAAVVFAARRR